MQKAKVNVFKSRYAAESSPVAHIDNTEYLTDKAKFAMELMARWGMVAASPDGEDSAGRAKLKLESEEHVVERACKMTKMAFDKFYDNGWVLSVPTLDELKALASKEIEEA